MTRLVDYALKLIFQKNIWHLTTMGGRDGEKHI